MATANRPQPFLSLLSAIATFGAIMGNGYRGNTGSKPNPYIIALAGTGCGKENPRLLGKHLLKLAGREQCIGADTWGSDGGFEAELSQSPEIIWYHDELNTLLRDLKRTNCPGYKDAIKRLLLSTYSGNAYDGKSLKDLKEKLVIPDPCPIVYATAQPGPFYELMDKTFVAEGFINRFLIYEAANHDVVPYDREIKLIPEGVPAELKQFVDDSQKAWGSDATRVMGMPRPIVRMKLTDAARDLDRTIHNDIETRKQEAIAKGDWMGIEVLARTREKMTRLSMIHAWSASPRATLIDRDSIDWARRMVMIAENTIMSRCPLIRCTDERYESAHNAVVATLRVVGERGITQSALARKHIMPRNMFDDILTMLLTSEVARVEVPKSGHGKKWYLVNRTKELDSATCSAK
jgi:hypothetical protein